MSDSNNKTSKNTIAASLAAAMMMFTSPTAGQAIAQNQDDNEKKDKIENLANSDVSASNVSTERTKEVNVEDFGKSKSVGTIETSQTEAQKGRTSFAENIISSTKESFYDGVEDGTRSQTSVYSSKEKTSIWGKIKNKVSFFMKETHVKPNLISKSNGYQDEYDIGNIRIESTNGRNRNAHVSLNYAPSFSSFSASDDKLRNDGTYKTTRSVKVDKNGSSIYDVNFNRNEETKKEINISPDNVSSAKTNNNGVTKATDVRKVGDRVVGHKVVSTGENITSSTELSDNKSERIFNRMQKKGDRIVGDILENAPSVPNLNNIATASEIAAREDSLNKKRQMVENFKRAKGLKGAKEEVSNIPNPDKTMPLGAYFDKNYDMQKLSDDEKKSAVTSTIIQSQVNTK